MNLVPEPPPVFRLNSEAPDLLEDWAGQIFQLRAVAPELGLSVRSQDAVTLVARDRELPAEAVRRCIEAWTARVASDPTAEALDRALASFFAGCLEDAAAHAETAARKLVIPRAKARLTAGEPLEKVRAVVAEERRAWKLTGQIHHEAGRPDEALRAYRRALRAAPKSLDPAAWASAAFQVAWVLDDVGDISAAEPLLREVLTVLEECSGPESLEVAGALNNLAGLLRTAGRFNEAEPLYRRALALAHRRLPANHPKIAIALNNLAALLRAMGRMADAEPLYRRALAIDEKNLGPAHPSVAISLNNLAAVLHDLGHLREAATLFQRSLEINEAAFGPAHPTVATDLNNLAVLLRSLREYDQAEALYRRSMAINESAFGPEHPDVATDLANLAMLLCSMDRQNEAAPLAQRAVKIALASARRTGRPAPCTRVVGETYRGILKELGWSDDELEGMVTLVKAEVEREHRGIPFTATATEEWMEAFMREIGVPYGRRERTVWSTPRKWADDE